MERLRFAPVPFWHRALWQEALVRLTARECGLTFFVSRVTLMGGNEPVAKAGKGAFHPVNSLACKVLYLTQRIVR